MAIFHPSIEKINQFKVQPTDGERTLLNFLSAVLDDSFEVCGNDTKDEIVMRMHNEKAFDMTDQRKLIHYEYAKELSIGV